MGHPSLGAVEGFLDSSRTRTRRYAIRHASQDISREQRQRQDLPLFRQGFLKRVTIADNVVTRIENGFSGVDETAIFLGIAIDACNIRLLGALKHTVSNEIHT